MELKRKKRINMVFIKGNIPSSKNSKIATSKGVFHSKTVGKFLREIGIQHYSVSKKEITLYKTKPCWFPFQELKELFKDVNYPCEIGLHFVRSSKTKFDFHNVSQIIFDLLVAWDIIPDDNMEYVIPYVHKMDGKWYSVDKDNPGVWITIRNRAGLIHQMENAEVKYYNGLTQDDLNGYLKSLHKK